MKLPESLYFLRPGWWAVHLLSVALVFAAGFLVAHHASGDHHREAGHDAHAEHDSEHDSEHDGHGPTHDDEHAEPDPHAEHASHHDHTAPETLRPLMRLMLVDAVQLQGALSAGDLARAARHADAIAGACDDGSETDSPELPDSLGPDFIENDRALHESASRLSAALSTGEHADAMSLNREMIAACRSCHEQAPSAQDVDLRALTSIATSLSSGGEL